jgi:hypothetical protein
MELRSEVGFASSPLVEQKGFFEGFVKIAPLVIISTL